MLAPKKMQDKTLSVNEPLEEVEISSDPNVNKAVSISSRLTTNEKQRLTDSPK